MGSEWKEATLGDLLTLQRGFDLPVQDRKEGPYLVIASNGPVGTHNKAMVQGPGVVIGRSGSIGGGQFLENDFWPLNTTLWVKDFKGNDPRFCFYLLKTIDFSRFNAGSGVPTLNRNHVHPLPINFPPLEEQRAIAAVLGALDDKIELNRRMNGTLEAMAQALFKSWFVDFDPVRAKMAGQETGLPEEIAALFPGEMEDGRPLGWEVRPLGEILELAYGKALKEANRRPGDVPVFGSNGQVGWHDEKLIEGPGIIVGRKGNPGIVTWSHTDFFCIDTTFYVVSKLETSALHYLHYALQHHNLASLSADSAVPGLNRNMAYGNIQVLPPVGVLTHFEEAVSALYKRIRSCEIESRTLAALRDALLPKLMSGEVRVPAAEREAADAL